VTLRTPAQTTKAIKAHKAVEASEEEARTAHLADIAFG